MKRVPGAVFIIDPHRERIAVTEANKLEVPVVATGDTNVDPDEIDHIIPANDDAIRSIRLLCTLIAEACIEGQQERAARATAEPEPEVAVAAEPEYDESAADELVAALAGGAALTFEPDADEEEDLLPGAPSRSAEPRRARRRGDPRRDRRRARPRGSREGRAGRRRLIAGPATRRQPTSRAGRGSRDTGAHEPRWPRSPPTRSRSCASEPARASWTARTPSSRRTATSTRRSPCFASGASPRPRRRPAATPARASSRATSTPAAGSACSSRSTARRTSSPGPTSSRSSSATSRSRSPGMAPRYVDVDRIPEADLEAKKAELAESDDRQEQARGRSGRRSSRASSRSGTRRSCLYEQPFRDEERSVRDLITEAIATIGENIRVRRFTRYALGEEL